MISIIESQPYYCSPVTSIYDYSSSYSPSHDQYLISSREYPNVFGNSLSSAFLNSLYERELTREVERRRISKLAQEKERQRQLRLSYLRQQEFQLKIPIVKTVETNDYYEIKLIKRRGSFDSYNIEKNIARNDRDLEISIYSINDNFHETFKIRDASINLDIRCVIKNDTLYVLIPKESTIPQLQNQAFYNEGPHKPRYTPLNQSNEFNGNNLGELFKLLLSSAEGRNSSNSKHNDTPRSSIQATSRQFVDKDKNDNVTYEKSTHNTSNEAKNEGSQDEKVQLASTCDNNGKDETEQNETEQTENRTAATKDAKRSESIEHSDTESIDSEYENITPSELSRHPSLEEVEDEEITRYKKSQSAFQNQ